MIAMRHVLMLLLGLFLLAPPALAQDATDTDNSMAPAATDDDANTPDNDTVLDAMQKNIFVLGDSLAGGLGAGMKRVAAEDPSLNVQLRYQEESGLSRVEIYDWPDAIEKIAESNKIDIAIVMIGSNDVRSIKDGDFVYAFGTKEWTATYNAQLDRLISSVKKTGAEVHWVSLPPMASPDYDQSIATIAALQKKKVQDAGIDYIDIRGALVNPDGTYMERGPDDTGDFRKLRDSDGVHFMKVGNNKIGALVLGVISGKMTAPEQPAAMPPVAVNTDKPAPGGPEVPGSGPIFGQMASADAVNVLRPAGTLMSGGELLPVNVIDLNLAAGSAAQKLFVQGQTPPPQAGRFDDFSYSAQ